MIQVFGTTYRIAGRGERCEVVRIRDEVHLGVFVHRPALRIVSSTTSRAELMTVAKAVLRAGCLPWRAKPSWTESLTSYWRATTQRLVVALLVLLARSVGGPAPAASLVLANTGANDEG